MVTNFGGDVMEVRWGVRAQMDVGPLSWFNLLGTPGLICRMDLVEMALLNLYAYYCFVQMTSEH